MLCLSGFELYSRWVPLTFDSLFPLRRLRMTMAVTFSRPNDVGSRARAHYTVLSIYCTHSHFKINIFCRVIYHPGYHVKVTRMLLKRKEGRREGGREG